MISVLGGRLRAALFWQLPLSTGNATEIWEKQKFKSNIFHLSWAPLSSPQFSPKTQPKPFFWTPWDRPSNSHVWISPCLLVIQTSRWWSCIRTTLGSNGNCQQSALWVLRVGPVCLKDMLNIFRWISYWVSDFKFVEGQPVATASPDRLAPLLWPTNRGQPG